MSVEYEDEYEEGASDNTRWVIAAVIAVVLAGGAFFAGKAMAGGGPATLAEAVKQAQAGDLPCGDTGSATGDTGSTAGSTTATGSSSTDSSGTSGTVRSDDGASGSQAGSSTRNSSPPQRNR